jgi:diguanylate cyclase
MTREAAYEKACRYAEETMRELARLRLSPTPENYRVWFVHLAGELPPLSQAIRRLLAGPEPIDEARCAELYERFFLRSGEERDLLRAGRRLNELAAELTRELAAFGTGAVRYGRALADAGERLAQAPPGHVGKVLANLIAETERMQERALHVERHLRASMGQIEELRREAHAAWQEARTDGLTGLANRRHFDHALQLAAAQAVEQAMPACLLLADIDHFKQFNDQFGHALGDQVLKLVAAVLRQNVKGKDLVARYGGEEFAIILPATQLEDAAALADGVRELVASRQIQMKDSNRALGRVTLSIGVTDHRPGESCADWVARADDALYGAKRGGRNRVVAVPASSGATAAVPARAVA